jgi:integrase
MAIFKRGRIYWYHFVFNSRHVQQSTKQGNPRVARQMEAAHRTALAKGEVGFRELRSISLRDFLKQDFLPFVESQFKDSKPNTLRYYQYGADTLREFSFGNLNLDQITDQHAGQYAAKRTTLSPSTINCGLRTLRRALSLAYQWGKLDRMPKITLAKGERQRERVLSDLEVSLYLNACSQPWRDAATIMLGTGLRPSEVLSLCWERIHLNGSGGLLQIAEGKSKAARRILPMVPTVHNALKALWNAQGSPQCGWIFPAESKSGHLDRDTAKTYHSRALAAIENEARKEKKQTPVKPFPPYTMRHTALTRLAEVGCDAFTLARIAGHSSITITQRYCHPQADAIERAFAKLPSGDTQRSDSRIGTEYAIGSGEGGQIIL